MVSIYLYFQWYWETQPWCGHPCSPPRSLCTDIYSLHIPCCHLHPLAQSGEPGEGRHDRKEASHICQMSSWSQTPLHKCQSVALGAQRKLSWGGGCVYSWAGAPVAHSKTSPAGNLIQTLPQPSRLGKQGTSSQWVGQALNKQTCQDPERATLLLSRTEAGWQDNAWVNTGQWN